MVPVLLTKTAENCWKIGTMPHHNILCQNCAHQTHVCLSIFYVYSQGTSWHVTFVVYETGMFFSQKLLYWIYCIVLFSSCAVTLLLLYCNYTATVLYCSVSYCTVPYCSCGCSVSVLYCGCTLHYNCTVTVNTFVTAIATLLYCNCAVESIGASCWPIFMSGIVYLTKR